LPHGTRTLTIEFDFIDHVLAMRTWDGDRRTLPLAPDSVANLYREVMRALDALGVPVKIWPVAVELPVPVRLGADTDHHSYDPVFARRLWRILTQIERVFNDARSRFVGKVSPVNFFWCAFDLAMTRFSGSQRRRATVPPSCAKRIRIRRPI
jgi:hypothetical protein